MLKTSKAPESEMGEVYYKLNKIEVLENINKFIKFTNKQPFHAYFNELKKLSYDIKNESFKNPESQHTKQNKKALCNIEMIFREYVCMKLHADTIAELCEKNNSEEYIGEDTYFRAVSFRIQTYVLEKLEHNFTDKRVELEEMFLKKKSEDLLEMSEEKLMRKYQYWFTRFCKECMKNTKIGIKHFRIYIVVKFIHIVFLILALILREGLLGLKELIFGVKK